MRLSDFDFDLPEDLIATRPAYPRSASRLLVAHGNRITDAHVSDLVDWLRPGDRLVLNDTAVIPARLHGRRARQGVDGVTTAQIDATLLAPEGDAIWSALLRPLKKIKIGETITFSADLWAELVGVEEGQARLRFNLDGADFDAALDAAGQMPLPPYIAARRAADEQDKTDYQTVFARNRGAVAAPTASLHLDDPLLSQLSDLGVDFSFVTLHVGAGTFLPVKVDDVTQHKMHAEWGHVSDVAAAEIAQTKASGGRVIPVGTTAMRLIESAAAKGVIAPWRGTTDIFIYPGFRFNICDGLMTNFHLPKSTLMMLVSALMGADEIRTIYAHAIAQKYRFFSYGDSSLLLPASR